MTPSGRRSPSSNDEPAPRRSRLDLAQLDAPLIGAFLDHLEVERGSSAQRRNIRLAAVRSLFRFAALRHPEHAAVIQRVLAMPQKRCERNDVTFRSSDEIEALLATPDRSTRIGRRDHAAMALALQTGLRVSEPDRLAPRGPPAREESLT